VQVDLRAGCARVAGVEHAFPPLPGPVLEILAAGGLWAAKTGMTGANA
jgi:hypothetical protein